MAQRQEQPWWAVIVLLAVFFPAGVIVLTLKALRETWARRKNGRMLCILGAISVCMGALGGALAVLSGADSPQIAAAIFGLPAAVLALFGVAILVWGALLLLGPDRFLLPSLLVTVAALTLLRPVLEPKYAEGGARA